MDTTARISQDETRLPLSPNSNKNTRTCNFKRDSPAANAVSSAIALFVDMMLYAMILPLLPMLLKLMSRPDEDAGILFGAYAIGVFLLTPCWGLVSDRYSAPRAVMIIGLVLLLFTSIVMAVTLSFPLWLLARLGQGASAGASWTVGLAICASLYGKEKVGTVLGLVLAANTAGQVIGPLLSGWLASLFGIGAPFYLAVALVGVALLVRVVIKMPSTIMEEFVQLPDHLPILKTSLDEVALETPLPPRKDNSSWQHFKDFMSMFRHGQIMLACTGTAVLSAVYCGNFTLFIIF